MSDLSDYTRCVSGPLEAELRATIKAQGDEIVQLRAALKAFADESADIAPNYDNHRLAILMSDGGRSETSLTVADLRVAASIFKQ